MGAEWLNYHHLMYFWVVAREGSVTRACEELHLAQPTISGQIKKLETAIGHELFDRSGRELVLTDVGQTVFQYANEIFSIGRELQDTLKGKLTGRPIRLVVGLPEVLPKLIAFRLLEPTLQLEDKVQLICREGPMEDMLAMLAKHELDVVLSDSPIGSMVAIKAFNHPLGECGVGIFGTPRLCRKVNRQLPDSLTGAPFILPAEHTAMRRSVDRWIEDSEIEPDIIGEMDDTALLKVFAEAGTGFIPGPLAIRKEIKAQYGLKLLLEIPGASETFYAITVERRLKHPAVVAISDTARQTLFT